jgi:hypothetical protein
MWLIDSTTIRLQFVTSAGSSPYAILSHTWNNNDEVTFQEFNSPDRDIAHPRFLKITETCRLARGRGIPYVWVDSCCIDKTSSAELTEAINSMFRWYRESTVCFTYLADLAVGSEIEPDLPKCKWFTRGWTLQELVAPRNVEFYDKSWNLIGDKISLRKALIEITRIQEDVLRDSNSLPNHTVAMRMSWAANRQTTREEDLAYCLLGIFDVYLPLIYGEGINAFIRLQEAIGQVTYDLSLFAWTDQDSIETRQRYHGILARSPAEFSGCSGVWKPGTWVFPTHEYTITNKGVRLTGNLYDSPNEAEDFLFLECWGPNETGLVFIRLVQTPSGYVRHCADTVTCLPWQDAEKLQRDWRKEIYISKTVTPTISESLTKRLRCGYYAEIHNQTRYRCTLDQKFPTSLWNAQKGCFMIGPNEEFTGLLELSISVDLDSEVEDSRETQLHGVLKWPRVFILLDNLAGGGSARPHIWQPWAVILPNREENRITYWPLECNFDIVSAVRSMYKYDPWSTSGATCTLVVPTVLRGRLDCERELEEKHTVGLTIVITIQSNENKTPIGCRLVVRVDLVQC